MKKLLLVTVLVFSLFAVGCSNEEAANNVEEAEVVIEKEPEIDWLALEKLDRVETYLNEQGVALEEGYETVYLNVTPNDVSELFVLPAVSGDIYCLTLDDEGNYQMIEGLITGDVNSTVVIKEDLLLVESDYVKADKSGRSMMIYKYLDEKLKKVITSPIILDGQAIVDYELGCLEFTQSTVDITEDTSMFSVYLISQYVDENGLEYNFKDMEYRYSYLEGKGEYSVNKYDKSKYTTVAKLRASVNTYGSDDTLKTFDDIYETEDLEACINYYYDNRSGFVEGAKEDFSKSIMLALKEVSLYFEGIGKNALSNIEVAEDLSFTFVRGEGQVEAKVQGLLAYYKAYAATPEGVEEIGYKVMFRDHDISKKIYTISFDSDKRSNVGNVLNYRIHADAGEDTLIPMANRIVTEDQLTEEWVKSTLLIPMTLTDEPVEWYDVRNAVNNTRIGDMKFTYIDFESDNFNINIKADHTIEGTLELIDGLYFIEIMTPSLGHLKATINGKTFRTDALTGSHGVNEDHLLETIGSEAVENLKSGQVLYVEGDIDTLLFSGFDAMDVTKEVPHLWFSSLYVIE